MWTSILLWLWVIILYNFRCLFNNFQSHSISHLFREISTIYSLVIPRSPDRGKLVANRYSLFFYPLQNAIIVIPDTDSLAPKQHWLSSKILNVSLFFSQKTKYFYFLHNSLIQSWLENPLSIIPIAFAGIYSTVSLPYLLSWPFPKWSLTPGNSEFIKLIPLNSFTWWIPWFHSSLLVRVIVVESKANNANSSDLHFWLISFISCHNKS